MDLTDKEYYNLIATIGMKPGVVTETIWKLAVHPTRPRFPARVTLICTYPGLVKWGEVMDAGGIWQQFCQKVLNDDQLKPELVPLMRSHDMIDDIGSQTDDRILSAVCFDLVSRFTEDKMFPLVASVTGGRKTMSSHLHTALSRHGRRQDRLVHTLVARELEGRQDFFYPQTLEDSDQVMCVDIEFHPLRVMLEHEALTDSLLPFRYRNTFVDAIRSFQFTDPVSVAIYLGQHRYFASTLQFFDTRAKPQASGQLSHQNLTTLLVLAQQIQNHGGSVTIAQLLTSSVQEQCRTVWNLNCKSPRFVHWGDSQDVHKAINRLIWQIENNSQNLPRNKHYLSIKQERCKENTRYTWQAEKPPQIHIYCTPDILEQNENWNTHFPAFPLVVN